MIEEFYRAHFHVVYGYLLSLCGDKALAEELACAAFLKAAEHIDRYDPKCKPSTWLCTIARNLYYNECKRRKRLVPLEEAREDAAPSPEKLCIRREQAEEVLAAVGRLPELQRRVVLMRLEGMKFADIGLALGRSETWARVTFFRAKAKIIAEVEGEI